MRKIYLLGLLAALAGVSFAQNILVTGVNYGAGNVVVESSGTAAPIGSCVGLARYTQTTSTTSAIWQCVNGVGYQQLGAGAGLVLNRSSMKFNWIGTVPNSQIFAQVLPDATEVYSVPSGCTSSRAEATIAATASTTFTIYKCTAAGFTTCSSVGTIVFSAAGRTGAFTCSSGFTLTGSSSQSLYIQGPGTADATLANVGIALYATHN